MELVLGLGKQLVKGRDVAGTGADGPGRRIGMLPRLEGQARLTWAPDLAQAHMPLGRIPEFAGFPRLTGLVDNQGNGFAADIDSGDLHRLVLQIQSPSV